MFTVLEDFADAGPLVLAASVSLHVRKHPALVSPEVILGAEEEDRELSDLVSKVLDVGGDASGVVDLCGPPSEERERQQEEVHLFNRTTETQTFHRHVGVQFSHLYVPSLTQMMSLYLGFFPARQSLQNQLPSGIAMFRQSGWKAAGQDSQHSSCPPATLTRSIKSQSSVEQITLITAESSVQGR